MVSQFIKSLALFIALISFSSCATPVKKIKVFRYPRYSFDAKWQADLDQARLKLTEATKWGRDESKPWQERYRIDTPSIPYQGYLPHWTNPS